MVTKLEKMLEQKLSEVIILAKTMQQDYKHEIGAVEDTEINIDAGIVSLEDALASWKKAHDEPEKEDEEHANSSRANSRTYQREMNRE